MNAPNDPFLSSEEAAQLLGVDRATLVRLVKDNDLAGKYFGSHLRVRESWLKNWLCTPKSVDALSHDPDVVDALEAYDSRVKIALMAGALHVSQIPTENADAIILPATATDLDTHDDVNRACRIMGIPFLTVEDIAKELNVSHVVVLNWIRRDEMRSKKIGKNWRTARLWLSEFIETPDAGPHLEGDANLELRRARLQLVRENYKRKRATKQQKEARARAQDESGPPVKRKRGRPRKKPISESAET